MRLPEKSAALHFSSHIAIAENSLLQFRDILRGRRAQDKARDHQDDPRVGLGRVAHDPDLRQR
jgi:hypothetical protein